MFPVSELDQHLASADMVVRIRAPKAEDIKKLKEGSIHASFLDPFGSPELLDHFNERKISAISFEMIPRTTLAQKMDFLSSQCQSCGLCGVLRAANEMHKIFPMMMTAAGTITQVKYLSLAPVLRDFRRLQRRKDLVLKLRLLILVRLLRNKLNLLAQSLLKLTSVILVKPLEGTQKN